MQRSHFGGFTNSTIQMKNKLNRTAHKFNSTSQNEVSPARSRKKKFKSENEELTFIKKKLPQGVLSVLQNLEAQSTHSFTKMYKVMKEPKKAQKQLYEPLNKKIMKVDKPVDYTEEYLQQLGVKTYMQNDLPLQYVQKKPERSSSAETIG